MRQRLLASLAILLAATCALAISAAAEETEQTQPIEQKEAEEDEEEGWASRFSGIIQADFTNVYFFRGILNERNSFIAQPWGELYYSLYDSEDCFIRNVTIGTGVWASFHAAETGAADNPKSLYEVDWYPLISVEFPRGFSLTTTYYFYTSPNDAFERVEEVNLRLAWDDSEALGRFALQPWVNLALETKRTSFGPNRGEGWQMGIEPTLFELPIENYPVTVTAPVELGLALNDYYEDDEGNEKTFGYISYGVAASVPLAFIPEAAGSWTFGLSFEGISLSDMLADTNGRHWNPVAMASVGVEF
jgi:hypothetical protein